MKIAIKSAIPLSKILFVILSNQAQCQFLHPVHKFCRNVGPGRLRAGQANEFRFGNALQDALDSRQPLFHDLIRRTSVAVSIQAVQIKAYCSGKKAILQIPMKIIQGYFLGYGSGFSALAL